MNTIKPIIIAFSFNSLLIKKFIIFLYTNKLPLIDITVFTFSNISLTVNGKSLYLLDIFFFKKFIF